MSFDQRIPGTSRTSFWIVSNADRWYVGTIGGQVTILSDEKAIDAACAALMRLGAEVVLARIPSAVLAGSGLSELTEQEAAELRQRLFAEEAAFPSETEPEQVNRVVTSFGGRTQKVAPQSWHVWPATNAGPSIQEFWVGLHDNHWYLAHARLVARIHAMTR